MIVSCLLASARRLVRLMPFAIAVAASAACSPGPATPSADRPTSSRPGGIGASVEPAACPFDLPPGMRVECGLLDTTERPDGGGRPVELPYAIVRARAPSSGEPVLLIGGGPGPNLSALVEASRDELPFRQSRDVVVLEMRGTGFATPSLDCPEVAGLATVALDGMTIDETTGSIVAATRDCRRRIEREGSDPASYLTLDRVDDLTALRRELGLSTWDVYATSYGTLVAQQLLAADGAAIRTLVLDSALPAGADLFHEIGANGEAARAAVLEACESKGRCRGPEPVADLYSRLVDELEKEPREIQFVDPWTGRRRSALADGEALVKGTFGLLYHHEAHLRVPDGIVRLSEGDPELLEQGVIAQVGWTQGSFGSFLSQLCAEGGWDGTTNEPGRSLADLPPVARTAWTRHRATHALQCDIWGVDPVDPASGPSNTAPTLVLAGQFDPITPPRWAIDTASAMEGAVIRVFGESGHGILFGGPACADKLVLAFVDDPSGELPPCGRSP